MSRSPDDRGQLLADDRQLEDQGWRNWILALGVLVTTTVGLGVVVLTLLNVREIVPWPWRHSETFLTITLVLTCLLFVAHLTYSQRRAILLGRESQRLQSRQLKQAQLHSVRIAAFLNLVRTLGSDIRSQVIFDRISTIALSTFSCDQVSLMLLDRKRQVLQVRSAAGHPENVRIVGIKQRVGHGVAGQVAETGEALILGSEEDLRQFVDLKPRSYPTSAAMVVPILLRDELIGVLSVSSRDPEIRYTEADLSVLEVFAEAAAVYCRFGEQTEWMRQTIRSLESATQEQRRGKRDD